MAFDPKIWRLCLVTDRPLARGRNIVDITAAAVKGGASMVQLREKTTDTREFLEIARALKALLTPLGVPLVVNDRVDIALAVDAEGVHVGQTDMPIAIVRQMIGPGKIVGLSCSRREYILAPDAAEADYLGIGPVYAQNTKPNANAQPHGPEGFAALRALTQQPVMAIGGLKPDNSAPVVAAGADGLAVVSAIVSADDPETEARKFAALYR
ncbi:MAG: thiamine phosphate synthase [Beijerinckiaceae bacterium]